MIKDENGMPEGYAILTGDDCIRIMKYTEKSHLLLRNASGKRKTFQKKERARAYAQKHAELQLDYDQIVPNWR